MWCETRSKGFQDCVFTGETEEFVELPVLLEEIHLAHSHFLQLQSLLLYLSSPFVHIHRNHYIYLDKPG